MMTFPTLSPQPKTLVSRDGLNYKQKFLRSRTLEGRTEVLSQHLKCACRGCSVCFHLSMHALFTRCAGSSCFSIFRKQILRCCWSLCNPKSGASVLPCHMVFRSSAFSAASSWNKMIFIPAVSSWLQLDELKWLLGRVIEGKKKKRASQEMIKGIWFMLICNPHKEKE